MITGKNILKIGVFETMLIGIVYNWKGLKEENYLYTLDEIAKYDFELLKDCINNPETFNDSSKPVAANKTWEGRLLKTDEEVKDFLRGRCNEDIVCLKEENPGTDYDGWYWENVLDNDLYGEKSETMKRNLDRLGFVTGDNHCPMCRGMLEKVFANNIEYRCIRCKRTF